MKYLSYRAGIALKFKLLSCRLQSLCILKSFYVMRPIMSTKYAMTDSLQFLTTTFFVFQDENGGKIFFSQPIFFIFGALASEIHTITQYNSPDHWTFCKSYGKAQGWRAYWYARCSRGSYSPPILVLSLSQPSMSMKTELATKPCFDVLKLFLSTSLTS